MKFKIGTDRLNRAVEKRLTAIDREVKAAEIQLRNALDDFSYETGILWWKKTNTMVDDNKTRIMRDALSGNSSGWHPEALFGDVFGLAVKIRTRREFKARSENLRALLGIGVREVEITETEFEQVRGYFG